MKCSLVLALLASLLAAPAVMAQPPAAPAKPAPTPTKSTPAQPAKKDDAAPKKDDKAKDAKPAAMEPGDKAGPNHEFLKQLVGEWQAEAKDLTPGQEATDKGTMSNTMVFGGRFLSSEFKGRLHGQFFFGGGMWGYNNTEKRFESSWADSSGTALSFMTGSVSADGKVFTMTGESTNPATGKKSATKEVTTITGKDSYKLEIYGDGAKSMEVLFTKGKAAEKDDKKDEKPKGK